MIIRTKQGLLLKIQVQPRSAKNQVVGPMSDRLKIKLTAPPADGAANTLLIKFLAKHLNLPKTRITLKAGHTNRKKTVSITCPDAPQQKELIRQIKALQTLKNP